MKRPIWKTKTLLIAITVWLLLMSVLMAGSLFAQTPCGPARKPVASAPVAKLSPQELRTRLKQSPAAYKAGPVTTVPVSPNKQFHTEMLAALQQQKQTVEAERLTILAAAKSSPGGAATNAPRGGPATPAPPGKSSGAQPLHLSLVPAASLCQGAKIATVNGIAPPDQSAGTSSRGRGVQGLQGQNGGTAIRSITPTPRFTTIPELNRYTIRGCGFGAQPNAVFLKGPFRSGTPNMFVEFWSDTAIVASMSQISGEPDISGDVTLVIEPQGYPRTPAIQATGFSFYAAREETPLAIYPRSRILLQPIRDVAGNNVPASPQTGDGWHIPNPLYVTRVGNAPFGSAQDIFDFRQLSPGFYLDKYQWSYVDPGANAGLCAPDGQGQMTITTNGQWSFVWDSSYRLHATTQEQLCHYTNPKVNITSDSSFSIYSIVVWVVGPKGLSPWPQNLAMEGV